jgi:hypothetical protein
MSMPAHAHAALEFLERVVLTPVVIQFEALTEVQLLPFPGPTLRGVIGRALLESWCEARPLCRADCAEPARCRFYERFARERANPGAGENQPKPWVFEAPPPPGLTALVSSGAVGPPYETHPGPPAGFDLLGRREPWVLAPGAGLDVRVLLIGRHGAWAGELASLLRNRVFDIGPGFGKLAVSREPLRAAPFSLSAEVHPARAARLELLTPLRLDRKGAWSGPGESLVRQIVTSALVRAIKLHDCFCRNDGGRLPRMELPEYRASAGSGRLWRYWLPRRSDHQDRAMEIGGLVGSVELEGELGPIMPLLAAAEQLHVGQGATFGLGRIRTVVWG